ncbi:MAG: MFS transporter [Candidatus Accumulibacter sp.]|jgi:MFS family permease|nr:MFS transporter [Accumulibacter sp.]
MKTEAAREYHIVVLICLIEILTMAAFSCYASFLPTLRKEWDMTAAQAGFVGGAFFFGYMLTVPILSSLTDRIDARTVFSAASCLNAAGMLGFAFFANSVYSAALFQALAGIGLAGNYMPGLKVMTDRVESARQSRYIAFYTASFGLATSLSLLNSGWLSGFFSWRTTMILLTSGPLLAALLMWLCIERKNPVAARTETLFSQFGKVWSFHKARRYIYGYTSHCMEVFGVRAWLVAFFTFAFSLNASPVSATEAAAIINLFGIPASILGNEAADRVGRKRWIVAIMMLSGSLSWIIGFSTTFSWWVTIGTVSVYFVSVMLDSSSLTAGLVQATPQNYRGTAMAIYSFFGFGIAFIAPMLFGAILDHSGGMDSMKAWTLAFGMLGFGCLVWSITNVRSEE